MFFALSFKVTLFSEFYLCLFLSHKFSNPISKFIHSISYKTTYIAEKISIQLQHLFRYQNWIENNFNSCRKVNIEIWKSVFRGSGIDRKKPQFWFGKFDERHSFFLSRNCIPNHIVETFLFRIYVYMFRYISLCTRWCNTHYQHAKSVVRLPCDLKWCISRWKLYWIGIILFSNIFVHCVVLLFHSNDVRCR